VTKYKLAESCVPIKIATMGQKYEFLAKNYFLRKWVFIAVFDRISLVFNVFVEILVKYYTIRSLLRSTKPLKINEILSKTAIKTHFQRK
jgi:hypothetical protein